LSLRILVAALIALGLAGAVQAVTPQPAAVFGAWRTNTDAGVVQISACGEAVCGALVSSNMLKADPDLADIRNKDPAKRARPVRGVAILSGFRWSGEAWTGGQLYNPSTGQTFNASLRLVDQDLVIKGCIAPLLCKSVHWRRLA
jgi:uncharacterized protein (DUF2147 family)